MWEREERCRFAPVRVSVLLVFDTALVGEIYGQKYHFRVKETDNPRVIYS